MRHVQAAGRHGRSGGGAVAAIQNAGDVLRADFSLRSVDDRSGHGAHHIVEKTVCAHAQEDQLSPALHVKIIHRADRGLHVRSDGADGSEIMRSDELRGGLLHDGFVQMLGIEPCPVHKERVADAGIINLIGIFLPHAGADGVEAQRDLPRAGHDDVGGQMRVERIGHAVDGDAGLRAEIGHIGARVDPGVRPAAAGHMHRMADDIRRGLLQRLRDGAGVFLHLPAVIGRSVIFQKECEIPHASSQPLQSIAPQDDDAGQHGSAERKRQNIAKLKAELLQLRAAGAAAVAAALHGRGQLVGAPECADEQRYKDRHEGLGTVEQISRFKIRAAGLLGRNDLIRLLDERRDEAQGNAHHESQLVHREMDGLQRREQGFQAVCQRDGRRRVGQKERARHEHDDAQHQEARVDKALPRDLKDPELHQHIALGIKYVDDSGKNDDKQQRLQALEQCARTNA